MTIEDFDVIGTIDSTFFHGDIGRENIYGNSDKINIYGIK
jgi:hypothetical protein